jgi:nucleoid-associated protein YgaU
MKKLLILFLALGMFGCSAKKQLVKLGEKIDDVEFQSDVLEDGVVYLAKQQVKIEKTIEDIKGDLDKLKGKVPEVITEIEKVKNSDGAMYRVGSWEVDKACLWRIALNVYGNASRWIAIYEANEGRIDNPNLIYENQILLIPNLGGK